MRTTDRTGELATPAQDPHSAPLSCSSHEKYKKGYVRPKNFKADYSLVKEYSATRAPKAINWRYTEAVTAIKNQGQCGSVYCTRGLTLDGP